jgi:uncharacterized membrane protein
MEGLSLHSNASDEAVKNINKADIQVKEFSKSFPKLDVISEYNVVKEGLVSLNLVVIGNINVVYCSFDG